MALAWTCYAQTAWKKKEVGGMHLYCVSYLYEEKREITDKREKRGPSKAWAWGTAPIAGWVNDKVSCRASGAAKVVLGRIQKCMVAGKVGFVGR